MSTTTKNSNDVVIGTYNMSYMSDLGELFQDNEAGFLANNVHEDKRLYWKKCLGITTQIYC